MTSIDEYFDREIKALEKKRALYKVGAEAAQAAGFDLDAGAAINVLARAYKAASAAHALEMGDGPYKPIDYDCYYPSSDEAYGRYVVEECKSQRIKALPPKLDMQEQLKVLDADYIGEGSLSDAFELVSRVSAQADDATLKTLSDFQNILLAQKDREIKRLGEFVGQMVQAKRTFTAA